MSLSIDKQPQNCVHLAYSVSCIGLLCLRLLYSNWTSWQYTFCKYTVCIDKKSVFFLIQFCVSFFPKGANVNAATLHETTLHHAAKTKSIDLIDLLVEFGGNVYARDNRKKKPIHYTSLGSPSYLSLEFYESKFEVCLLSLLKI